MLKIRGQAEDDGIPETRIGHFMDELLRLSLADLKNPAGINLSTQINAQGDQPMVPQIAVPRIVMATARNDTIDPPQKATNWPALRNALNQLKYALIVQEQME